jgi:hypothetical protein
MLLTLCALALFSATETAKDDEAMGKWLTYYYLDPKPLEAVAHLKPLNDAYVRIKGSSLAEVSERGGIRTFYSEIFESSPDAVKEIERRLPELEVDIRVFVNAALARCDSQECERVRGFPIEKREEPLSVSLLDDYWAAYMATGEKSHVEKVISALPLIEVRGDVDRLMIGGAAKWSLSSNAYQHSRVLQICEETELSASEPLKGILKKVILEAKSERLKNPPPEPLKDEI